ncbi:MAG TPA: DUF559 domain-containing protein, partial [Solirubrobacterales bacterium]|nr:DUF559 domain-containing protein [Solirubrobacterales bacterium]
TAAFDEGIRIGIVIAAEVEAACLRSGGRPGTDVLLRLARAPHLPFERTRSRPEGRFLRFCAEHGLPIPLVNVPLLGHEVDFLWPAEKLAVEMDSSYHDSPTARAADAARDAQLAVAGFRVVRVRPRRLATAPGALAAALRALIAGAAPG